jgi:hypothetical protein
MPSGVSQGSLRAGDVAGVAMAAPATSVAEKSGMRVIALIPCVPYDFLCIVSSYKYIAY